MSILAAPFPTGHGEGVGGVGVGGIGVGGVGGVGVGGIGVGGTGIGVAVTSDNSCFGSRKSYIQPGPG